MSSPYVTVLSAGADGVEPAALLSLGDKGPQVIEDTVKLP